MRSDDTIPAGIPALSSVEPTGTPIAVPQAPGALLGQLDGEAIVFELADGRSLLGAGASVEMHVAASGLADEHVAFECSGADVVATALAPVLLNGARHDGDPAKRMVLRSGDVLVAGELRLCFAASEDAVLTHEQVKEAGVLWWGLAGWAGGYLAVLLLVMTGLVGPAAAGLEAALPVPVAAPAKFPEDGAGDALQDEEVPREPPATAGDLADHVTAVALVDPEPVADETVAAPVPTESPAPPPRAVAALRRREAPALRTREKTPAGRPSAGRAGRKGDLVERMMAAWQGGAIEDVVALGEGAAEVEAHRLALLARRFSRASERARRTQGIAAAPALEEALGVAEEIGRDAPPVQDVRRELSALHRTAARRAEARGDLEGAVHHCEQALAVRPGDSEAREMRRELAERARPIYLDGYALQHLDPTAALRLFERASLLAMPGDPTGTRAAALAAKMRADVAGGSGDDGL